MSGKVLNIGGGGRSLPSRYDGWEQVLLDIDPDCHPDICGDALEMRTLDIKERFDAVYCSHTLEHFYQHDLEKVLVGCAYVLKSGGILDITVPNLQAAMAAMMERSLDLNDVFYRTSAGLSVTFHDVLFGWSQAIRSGKKAYAHKCGFTANSLFGVVVSLGLFIEVQVTADVFNLQATAKRGPAPCQ